jgi:hypothetical protein
MPSWGSLSGCHPCTHIVVYRIFLGRLTSEITQTHKIRMKFLNLNMNYIFCKKIDLIEILAWLYIYQVDEYAIEIIEIWVYSYIAHALLV